MFLLNRIRNKTGVLKHEMRSGRTNVYDYKIFFLALTRLVHDRRYWIRDVFDWNPDTCLNWRRQVASLARHLLTTHYVPTFLDRCWWREDSTAKQHRTWFRHIGRGNSVLGLQIHGLKTKTEATKFLMAPDHFSVAEALAWARKPIEPIVFGPVYPAGLSRLRRKRLIAAKQSTLWRRIGVSDFQFTESRIGVDVWQIRQIRTKAKLIEEGKEMNHCVGIYADLCSRGKTTIWSMTRKRFDGGSSRRVLTIEVVPGRRMIQASGYKNRDPSSLELKILKLWAKQEQLKLQL